MTKLGLEPGSSASSPKPARPSCGPHPACPWPCGTGFPVPALQLQAPVSTASPLTCLCQFSSVSQAQALQEDTGCPRTYAQGPARDPSQCACSELVDSRLDGPNPPRGEVALLRPHRKGGADSGLIPTSWESWSRPASKAPLPLGCRLESTASSCFPSPGCPL